MGKLITTLGAVAVFYFLGSIIGSLAGYAALYAAVCAIQAWLTGTASISDILQPFVILGIVLLFVLISAIIGLTTLFFKK